MYLLLVSLFPWPRIVAYNSESKHDGVLLKHVFTQDLVAHVNICKLRNAALMELLVEALAFIKIIATERPVTCSSFQQHLSFRNLFSGNGKAFEAWGTQHLRMKI